MFNKKSDYALNKRDKDTIVYISVTGAVRLTRADFPNEAEFLKWKHWSDGDYRATEKAGRSFYDNCVPLDDHLTLVGAVLSVEDALFLKLAEAEAQAKRAQRCAELMVRIRNRLTEKQFRRLWMFHVDGMTVTGIAATESVSKASVSKSISSAEKIIHVFLSKQACQSNKWPPKP